MPTRRCALCCRPLDAQAVYTGVDVDEETGETLFGWLCRRCFSGEEDTLLSFSAEADENYGMHDD